MTTLREARESARLDQFIAEHEADPVGDEAVFNATLALMAGTSKAVPATSSPDDDGD